jgi:hypothetical protein
MKVIHNIDWKQLRNQKASLLDVMRLLDYFNSPTLSSQAEDLHGILHLIDAVQDAAVDEYGYSEKEVFHTE